MTHYTDVVIGLDIGTTSSKALIRPMSQAKALYTEQPTPWTTHNHGQTDIDPHRLTAVAVDLIGGAVQDAERTWGNSRVRAIGVTGLAESGVLLGTARRPVAPAIAWFDHRGTRELDQLARQAPEFAQAFPRTTGLPWSSQASLAKLLWLRASGQVKAGPAAVWLSVPEWIVFALGGDPVREPSLASRTGLVDQDTGAPWPAALEAAGLSATILPAERLAGQPAGRLTHHDVPTSASGAILTVAGHDHPVAAIGVGATGPDELFNSSGTADVLARSVPGMLTPAQRQAVVDAGWSAGRHVLPDTSLLLAGVSGGLLLRRILAALGAEEEPARTTLDHASLTTEDLPPAYRSPATAAARTTWSCASRTAPPPPPSGPPPSATRPPRPATSSGTSRRSSARTGGRWPPAAGRGWPACARPRRPRSAPSASRPKSSRASPAPPCSPPTP